MIEIINPISGNSKYYLNDLSYRNYLYADGYGLAIFWKMPFIWICSVRAIRLCGGNKRHWSWFCQIKGERRIYLQVTLQLTDEKIIDREYQALKLIGIILISAVVSMDDYKIPTNEGIEHISAWNLEDFLNSL